MCYCSKSAEEGQGLAEKKRKEKQRGLGILPYGNFIIRTVGKYGEFRPCVRTWAVLAILPTTLPEGVSVFRLLRQSVWNTEKKGRRYVLCVVKKETELAIEYGSDEIIISSA